MGGQLLAHLEENRKVASRQTAVLPPFPFRRFDNGVTPSIRDENRREEMPHTSWTTVPNGGRPVACNCIRIAANSSREATTEPSAQTTAIASGVHRQNSSLPHFSSKYRM